MNWRSLFTNFLLVVISIFIALSLAEIFFRFFMPQDLIVPMPATADKELIYRLPPNTKAYLRGTSVRWFHLETNSLGLRDSEHDFAKSNGVFRILLLGDSMSMAEGVELAETYIKQLEKKTNNEAIGKKIETINAAIRGYGTDQETVLFERLGMKFNPDLVILAFFEGNDFDDNRQGSMFQLKEGELIKTIPTEESSPKMRYYRKQIMIQNFPGYRFMVGHSHLANFLRKKYADYLVRRVVSAQKDDEKSHAAQGPKVVSEADWSLTKQILLRWREDCRKINSTPLILFIPDSKNVRSYAKLKTVSNRTDKIMGDFAYANNILFIDLTDQFLRYPDVESLYLQDGHFSPLGHDIVGGEIARFLRARTII